MAGVTNQRIVTQPANVNRILFNDQLVAAQQ